MVTKVTLDPMSIHASFVSSVVENWEERGCHWKDGDSETTVMTPLSKCKALPLIKPFFLNNYYYKLLGFIFLIQLQF